MGIAHATLTLSNPVNPALASLECRALADTGALHLCIPEHVALQLHLSQTSQDPREVTLADGSKRLIPDVGPIRVQFGNRQCFVGGLVMGDEVLLAAIPMEDMDLVVRPMTREVIVNPASPNIPSAVAKGYRALTLGVPKLCLRADTLGEPQRIPEEIEKLEAESARVESVVVHIVCILKEIAPEGRSGCDQASHK